MIGSNEDRILNITTSTVTLGNTKTTAVSNRTVPSIIPSKSNKTIFSNFLCRQHNDEDSSYEIPKRPLIIPVPLGVSIDKRNLIKDTFLPTDDKDNGVDEDSVCSNHMECDLKNHLLSKSNHRSVSYFVILI